MDELEAMINDPDPSATLEKMLGELKVEFLDGKGSQGGNLEEFQAWLRARLAIDPKLAAAVLMVEADRVWNGDDEDASPIDTAPW